MKVEISRRRFLQGSVALSVVGAGLSSNLLAREKQKSKTHTTKKVPTLCEMCVNKCAAFAIVEDGIVKKLDPNPLFPKSKNMLCARGGAGVHALYDPDRLKYPLMHIGEKRGDGKYKRVTWDEAYEYIKKKLVKILDEEKDNRSTIAYCAGEGMAEHTFASFMGSKFGSANFVNHSTICLQTAVSGYATTIGPQSVADLKNAKYVIMAGANRAEAIVTPDSLEMFKRTRNRGMKLIVLDPRFTNTAIHADEYYAIKPGTDLAFVLALTHVVLEEKLYDKEFVANHFNGFKEYEQHIFSHGYTPEWAEKITGIPASEITKIAREFMANAPQAIYYQGRRSTFAKNDFNLRRAQAIFTALGGGIDVKGGLIFGKTLPLESHEVNAPMYANAKERVDKDAAAIVGGSGTWIGMRNLIVEGKTAYPVRGMFVYKQNPMLSVPNSAKTKKMFEKMDLVVTIDTMPSDTALMSDIILPECTYLEREDPVKSFGGSEPAIALRQRAIKPMYESKPVLEIMRGLTKVLTKPLWEITKKYDEDVQDELEDGDEKEYYSENGFDLTDAFLSSQEEINHHMFATKYGADAWKTLRQKGVYYPNMDKYFKKLDANTYEYYPEDKRYYSVLQHQKSQFIEQNLSNTCVSAKDVALLKTGSKKVECVLKVMEKKGLDTMPTWNDEWYKKVPEGKFKFITGRHAQFTQNSTCNNIMLLELMPTNYVWINDKTAKKMGINFGDEVEVKSKTSAVRIKAYPTDAIIEEVAFYVHGFGAKSDGLDFAYKNGASDNQIIEDNIEPTFGAAIMHDTIVDIRKV